MADVDGGFRPHFHTKGVDGQLVIVKGNKVYGRGNNPTLVTNRSIGPPPPPGRPRKRSSVFGVSWVCGSDPEKMRRRRIARYKAYAVEGNVKRSLKNGARWIKIKWSDFIRVF